MSRYECFSEERGNAKQSTVEQTLAIAVGNETHISVSAVRDGMPYQEDGIGTTHENTCLCMEQVRAEHNANTNV